MNATTPIHDEFYRIWQSSVETTETATETENVIRRNFEDKRPSNPNLVTLDNLEAILREHDPENHEQGMAEARQWVAGAFYPGEHSLRSIRLHFGLSQEKLAEMSHTSQSYIARIESGKVDPQTDTIARIAEVLKINDVELYAAIRESRTRQ